MTVASPPDDPVATLWSSARPDDLRRIADLAMRLFAAAGVAIVSGDEVRYASGDVGADRPMAEAPLVPDGSAGAGSSRAIGALRVFSERSWNDGDRATLDDLAACLCALIENRHAAARRPAAPAADASDDALTDAPAAHPDAAADLHPLRGAGPTADGEPAGDGAGDAEDGVEPGSRILLADDLDLNRKLISDMLTLDGHAVHSVSDGEAAVQAAVENSYDLILMDMIMPVMDGMAATRAIRALPAPACDVPIVALTAYSLPDQLDNCMRAGVDAVLIKPMSVAALSDAIATWSGRRRAA